jgi:flavin reductase (DIM6/NTAB) family NADH-FMN oxidoreductase RutF
MADKSLPAFSPVAQALGRVPSGLYILTVSHEGRSTGMLASWVQQAGFQPPMVTVAVASQRFAGDWVAASGRFTLNQIAAGGKALIRHFGRGFPPETPAFEGLTLRDEPEASAPVLAGALAYLDLEVAGELLSGDHRIFLGRVVAGAVFDEAAEPMHHVRHNGFHY